MNNFKKLLASAMALTMVTTVVPANVTSVDAALIDNVCDVADFEEIKPVLEWLLSNKTSMDDVQSTEFANDKIDGTYTIYDWFIAYTGADSSVFPARRDLLEKAVSCASESELEKVEYLYNAVTNYNTFKTTTINDILAKSYASDFEKYNALVEYSMVLDSLNYEYNGNLDNTERDQLANRMYRIEEEIDKLGFDSTDTLKTYTEGLKEKIETFVKDETQGTATNAINSITKTELTSFIKSIKADSMYKAFADEEPVVEIMEELDSWYDEIESVTDAINTKTNESYKDMLDVIEEVDGDYTGKDVVSNLTMADWEVFKAYKEDVVDVVWTMETEVFAKKHYDESSKSYFITNRELVNVLTTLNGGEKVALTEGDRGYLVNLVDTKDGLFGWNVLEARMEAVIEAYELIDVELDKLVAKNLTVNDKDMILALDDAYDYLTNEGKDNLTSAEAKVVRRAERTIDELYEAYRVKFGSLAETTGWVDMGNGDWKYFDEDGTAPTKWICTAPNTWYYVQNGVMLRNAWVWRDADSAYYVGDDGKMVYGPTTVDGYELDANGLWHR